MAPSPPRAAGKRATEDRAISPPASKRLKQQSTTTQKAVANFFTPASKKEPEKLTWHVVDQSLLVGRYKTSETSAPSAGMKRRKIAAFDFDSTLITPASGCKFAKDASDWKWWHGSVPGRLRSLYEDGYIVTILSNQSGLNLKEDTKSKSVKSDRKRVSDFKTKVSAVLGQLDLPLTIYAATTQDRFRKPRTGMWNEVCEEYDLRPVPSANEDCVDIENSFFIGDAGGRVSNIGGAESKKTGQSARDFSCSDRNFAANVGIAFKTPEEYFLNAAPAPFEREFDPKSYLQDVHVATPVYSKAHTLELVIFCGSPASGKSTFYWKVLKPLGYERVNQDTLKTRDKCLKQAEEYLKGGISVATDNTNADLETRSYWVKLARSLSAPIRCIWFTAPARLCEHNDAVRALTNSDAGMNPEARTILPKSAFAGFTARFREPKKEEGFEDITKVDFKVCEILSSYIPIFPIIFQSFFFSAMVVVSLILGPWALQGVCSLNYCPIAVYVSL
ncbi:polynucleotide kinase 3 phosphatase-domain-containing protein [Lineolata rhizophorae]|uniref:Polynucleotide kinase 3 phosphatase-domain-containing protein n=1 Tax=Lineolata rhizophorae TaxID=578093 RepID=A0A6A6PC04_9PEZI|nr:polynucleotide kinase 3 phosphatase-domain-containing protein [Lineolata rhizophorae]